MPLPVPSPADPLSDPVAVPIEVRQSGIHGHGVFAVRAIARGESIGRYAGRRYTAEQAAAVDWDPDLTYLFGLADGSLIDGSQGGNAMRFINHSCAPNCVAYEVAGDDGLATIEIEALRRIEPGAELLLDYRLEVGEEAAAADYACRCGTRRCRGSLRAVAGA